MMKSHGELDSAWVGYKSMRRKWALTGEMADSRRGLPVLTEEQQLFVLTCMDIQSHRYLHEMCSMVKHNMKKPLMCP